MFTQRDYKRNTYNKKEIDLCPNYCSLKEVKKKKQDNTETNTQKQDNTETNTQKQKVRKITKQT